MKSKRNPIGILVRKIPFIGYEISKLGSSFLVNYKGNKMKREWGKNKKLILKEAKALINENIDLDVSIRDGLFIFHNRNNSLINFGDQYEPEVQIALKTLINLYKLRNSHVVFADIGANIGLHTLHILNNFPKIEIIAFDPSPFSYKYLDLTIRYNKIKNVRLENVGLSAQKEELDFFSWGKNSSADSFRDTKRVLRVIPTILKVSAISLDSLKDIPPINIMKIDTEGAELNVLKGALRTIRSNQPFIVIEFNIWNRKAFNVETKEIFDLLQNIDYSILTLNFELLNAQQFDHYEENYITENYILLPNSFLKSFS